MARRRRLLTDIASADAGMSTGWPVAASTAPAPVSITSLPSGAACSRSLASASSTAAACGAGCAPRRAMAASRASVSSPANGASSAGSRPPDTAAGVQAPASQAMARRSRSRTTNALRIIASPRLQALLAFIAGNVRTPRLGADRPLALPHHVELAVRLDLADVDRLVQVVVGLVHLHGEAVRRLEGLAAQVVLYGIDVSCAGLLDRLLPHVDANVVGCERVIGACRAGIGQSARLWIGAPLVDEGRVDGIVDRLVVVPGGQVVDQR